MGEPLTDEQLTEMESVDYSTADLAGTVDRLIQEISRLRKDLQVENDRHIEDHVRREKAEAKLARYKRLAKVSTELTYAGPGHAEAWETFEHAVRDVELLDEEAEA